MKKSFALLVVCMLVIGLLAGCGGGDSKPANKAAAPAKSETINIYTIWPEKYSSAVFAAFTKETGIKVNFLRFSSGEALARVGRLLRQAEQGRCRQAQRLARLGGQAAADDQRDAAAGAHFVEQYVALDLELGDHFAVLQRLAFVRAQLDHVAVVHL